MVIPLSASVRVYRPGFDHLTTSFAQSSDGSIQYAALSKILQANGVPPAKCAPSKLAMIIKGLRHYLDQHFGRESNSEISRKITIWPSSLFSDFSESGSLFCMFVSMFSFCDDFGIDNIDFIKDANENKLYFHLIMHIEKALKRNHHFPSYKIFIAANIPESEIVKLRSIAQDHGSAIVSAVEVATHVLYPDPPNTVENHTDGQVIVRLLARTNQGDPDACLVHWFYHPDSYDDWVPRDEVLGHMYHPKQRAPHHQWHLQARWLRDLQLFNEWMNELDYEMPLAYKDFIGIPACKYDSYLTSSPPMPITRLRLRINAKRSSGNCRTQNCIISGLDSDNGDAEQGRPEQGILQLSATTSKPHMTGFVSHVDPEDDVPLVSQLETRDNTELREGLNTPSSDSVTAPPYATWFKLHTIHEIERRSLIEFFSGLSPSKTAEIYKEMRNFMVLTWRQKSQQYLSATFVRRSLSGDACSILRVHTFLEHWGLINYTHLTDQIPSSMSSCVPMPIPTNAGVEDGVVAKKGVHLILDDGSKVKIEDDKIIKNGALNGIECIDQRLPSRVAFSTSGTHAFKNQSENNVHIEYRCDSCRMECSRLRFRCATKADVNLCASCYNSRQYSTTIKHSEFMLMSTVICNDAVRETTLDLWTENETLLLLEALELYPDNWDSVAEHVGSKGRVQCVVHFLRLPIEDGFIGSTKKSWWSEHPFDKNELPTPLETLRSCGARETALATIAMKGSGSKKVSGQPIVCGDQINTIVPFIEMLSSLVPSEMVKEIVSKMDLKSTEVDKNIFRTFLGDKNSKGGNEYHANLIKNVLSDDIYHRLLNHVQKPSEVMTCEYGKLLVTAITKLLSEGSISDEISRYLALRDSECDLKSCISQLFPKLLISNDYGYGRKKCSPGTRAPQQNLEKDSSSAVAMAILCSACVSANQLASIEDIEIGRLKEVVTVMKMEIIQRRLEQLKTILRGERVVKWWLKRKREERQCYETIPKRRIITDDCCPSGSRSEPIITAGPLKTDICAGLCQNNNITLRDSRLTTFTVAEDLTSKLCMSMPELPNFLHEEIIDNVATIMTNSVNDNQGGVGDDSADHDDDGDGDELPSAALAAFGPSVSEAVATATEAAASEMAAERN